MTTTRAAHSAGRTRRSVWRAIDRWVVLAGALLLWQVSTWLIGSPYFPTPTAIFSRLMTDWFSADIGAGFLSEKAHADLGPSIVRLVVGWSVGAIVGVCLGLALGRSPIVRDCVTPVMHFVRSLPKTALVPIFLIVFGGGDTMRTVLIAFGVMWPIVLNTLEGVSQISQGHLDAARAYNISRWRTWTRVILPGAAPKIAAGMRISIAIALVLLTVSEMILSTNGLGFALLQSQRRFDFEGMWAVMVIFGALGFGLNWLFLRAESKLLAWHELSTKDRT